MAPNGMERNRNTAKKSGMAAVALFVTLAAVPALADTAQEKVIRRLSSETSTGAGGPTSQGKETRSVTPASHQMRQELEQGSYQVRFIRRISGETCTGVGRKNANGKEATRSGTQAPLQVSQELEQRDYQQIYIRRLAGETFLKAQSK